MAAWLSWSLMALWRHQYIKRTSIVITQNHRLTAAQLAVVREAAVRPGRTLEPLSGKIRGAARQAVVDALVAHGYATRCFFPSHVEYVLTDFGVAAANSQAAGEIIELAP